MKEYIAKEFRVQSLREAVAPEALVLCDTPECADKYLRAYVTTSPLFDPNVENFMCLYLNTRRRIIGHSIISKGLMDTLLVHPREVFRPAIVINAAALILAHNHPSGESTPSEADIKVTRELIRAGQLLKIEVLDHVILGFERRSSLRELGYFYA